MIAALYVEKGGVYYGLPDVDPWPLERDARKYAGPWPVVAHPPCTRWCMLAGLVQHRYGYKKGDDGGCFAAALAAVRRWGGVLEHPAFSAAFVAHDIAPPRGRGGWQRTLCGGWVCCVDQWNYGHAAKKATWLYAHGVFPPALDWSRLDEDAAPAYVTDGGGDVKRRRARSAYVSNVGGRHRQRALLSFCANHTDANDGRRRLGKKEANATPIPFRDLRLSIARTAQRKAA